MSSNIICSEAKGLLLDFGSDVALSETPMRRLHIKNNTAISAPFSINMEYFYAKPPTPPDRKPDGFMPNKRWDSNRMYFSLYRRYFFVWCVIICIWQLILRSGTEKKNWKQLNFFGLLKVLNLVFILNSTSFTIGHFYF